MEKHGVLAIVSDGQAHAPKILNVVETVLGNLHSWTLEHHLYELPCGPLARDCWPVRLVTDDEWDVDCERARGCKADVADLAFRCLDVEGQLWRVRAMLLPPGVHFGDGGTHEDEALRTPDLGELGLPLRLHEVGYYDWAECPIPIDGRRVVSCNRFKFSHDLANSPQYSFARAS